MGPDTLPGRDGVDPDGVPGCGERRRGRGGGQQRHDRDGDHSDDGGERDEHPAGSRAARRTTCAPRRSGRHRGSVFQSAVTATRLWKGGWQLRKKHCLGGIHSHTGV